MRAALDSFIATEPLTNLQKAQYTVLKRFADNGVDGWLDLSVLPQGGLISVPEVNRSYFTAGAVNLVRRTILSCRSRLTAYYSILSPVDLWYVSFQAPDTSELM